MRQKIYILMTCDQWKSKDSMRVYAACTSLPTLRRLISDGIQREVFSYGEAGSFRRQAKAFRTDWQAIGQQSNRLDDILRLCGNVKYAYVEVCENGVTC